MSLFEHFQTGVTTVCRCWAVTRGDGRVFGFTDHDRNLAFEGITFKADTGLTASALSQVSGLAVDNGEALGALSQGAVTEKDIAAGRFDGAQITAWKVNWADPSLREVQFAGSIGEIKRAAGGFHAELRGVSEALNTPVGRIYQKPCQAVLGDSACGVDLSATGYAFETVASQIEDGRVFVFDALPGFAQRWFERGQIVVLSGQAQGLTGAIKNDRTGHGNGNRRVELWDALRLPVIAGDTIRLVTGCDKRIETCRAKFGNVTNFRGFPHIPGDDWLMSYPSDHGGNDGGSRYQ